MDGRDWFRKRELADGLTVYDEPFVHDFFRANMFHLRGPRPRPAGRYRHGARQAFGGDSAEPGKPLLALATHIHVDHVGSLQRIRRTRRTGRQRASIRDDG